MQTFPGASKTALSSISLSADGRYVLAVRSLEGADVWDRVTGQPVYASEDVGAYGGAVHPGGRAILVWGVDGMRAIDPATFAETPLADVAFAMPVAFPACGDDFVAAVVDDRRRHVFAGFAVRADGSVGERWRVAAELPDFVKSPLAVSPGGVFFAAQSIRPQERQGDRWADLPSVLHLRAAAAGELLHRCELPPAHRLQAVTDAGLVYVTHLSRLMLWDVAAGAAVAGIKLKGAGRTDAVLAPDGGGLLARQAKSVFQLTADPLAVVREMTFPLTGDLRSVAYAPDGLTAAVGTGKGQFAIWDLA